MQRVAAAPTKEQHDDQGDDEVAAHAAQFRRAATAAAQVDGHADDGQHERGTADVGDQFDRAPMAEADAAAGAQAVRVRRDQGDRVRRKATTATDKSGPR